MKKRDRYIYLQEQSSYETNYLAGVFDFSFLSKKILALNNKLKENRMLVSFVLLCFIVACFTVRGF